MNFTEDPSRENVEDDDVREIADFDDESWRQTGHENGKARIEYTLRSGKRVKLTTRQRLFVAEDLKDMDGEEAAKRAG